MYQKRVLALERGEVAETRIAQAFDRIGGAKGY